MRPEFRVVADSGDDLAARTSIPRLFEECFDPPAERKPDAVWDVGLRRDRNEHRPLKGREEAKTERDLVERCVERRLERGVDEHDEVSEATNQALSRVRALLVLQRFERSCLQRVRERGIDHRSAQAVPYQDEAGPIRISRVRAPNEELDTGQQLDQI